MCVFKLLPCFPLDIGVNDILTIAITILVAAFHENAVNYQSQLISQLIFSGISSSHEFVK